MSHPNELEKADIQHEEGDIDKEVLSDPYIYENLIRGAIDSSEAESKMGFVGLWKIYYPAAIWSMSLSVALVMEGMDIGLVSLTLLSWGLMIDQQFLRIGRLYQPFWIYSCRWEQVYLSGLAGWDQQRFERWSDLWVVD
jgi:hypothetical protein